MHASISRFLLLTGGLLFASGVHAQLDPGTMDGHLAAGAPILGTFEQSNGQLANWMAGFQDSLAIERLNIPGTHDSAAWNYTQLGAAFVVTQDKPLFDQLDSGIRFFDLRIGLNNGVINFYHGSALLSASASLEDIFWGFYHWLDAHPTETLLVSIKVDNGPESPELQQTVYNLMTGADTAAYWVQSQTLGTLGEARKKIILFRRFSFDALTDVTPIGLNFATGWQDNNPSFSISFGEERFAFIEDYYDVEGATTSDKIAAKFAALTANVESAMTTNDTQLFISFASGFSGVTVTPKILAEGNSSMSGINSQSLDWLESHRGSRFGVILFDFFASEAGLVNATIGFENGPRQPKPSGSASAGPSGSTNDAITFRRGYLIETCILGLGLGFFLPF